MKSLIGHECRCVFNLPHNEWPIPGYPAWVYVVDVDMPMVCMSSSHGGTPMWVNAATIKTIAPVRPERTEPRSFLKRWISWT